MTWTWLKKLIWWAAPIAADAVAKKFGTKGK